MGIILSSALCRAASPNRERHLLYAAVDEQLLVYDIEENHRLVKKIDLPGVVDVRGIAASAITGRLYLSYYGKTPEVGHMLCLDLSKDSVLWDKPFEPRVDRMALTPDGKTIYLPSGEDEWSAHWFVVDALSGEVRNRVYYAPRTHNTIVSLDGSVAYIGTLRSSFLGILDTKTNKLIKEIGPFGGSIRPFTVNGAGTLAFVNVDGLLGFEIADLTSAALVTAPASGNVVFRVEVAGFRAPDRNFLYSHGIALTPDEREVWVCNSWNGFLHVFDVSNLPPRQVADLRTKRIVGWITFNFDGRFAYPSTGEVFDTKTRKVVAQIAESRMLVEVDFLDDRLLRVSDQFGVGRVMRRTNQPPSVVIQSPAATAVFGESEIVTVTANASDKDGSVQRVEFVVRGPITWPGSTRQRPQLMATMTAPPYLFLWHGHRQGDYELFARAVDNKGATVTSAPVRVTRQPASR